MCIIYTFILTVNYGSTLFIHYLLLIILSYIRSNFIFYVGMDNTLYYLTILGYEFMINLIEKQTSLYS